MPIEHSLPTSVAATVHYEDAPEGPPDAVADFSHKAGIRLERQMSFRDSLAYLGQHRFALPYAEGGELAEKRAHGIELRTLTSRQNLTYEELSAFDKVLGFEAGSLELIDCLGPLGASFATGEAIRSPTGIIPVAQYKTRTEPVWGFELLPIMVQALAPFYYETAKPTPPGDLQRKRKRKRGPMPERMSNFLSEALGLAGWDFTPAQIAKHFKCMAFEQD